METIGNDYDLDGLHFDASTGVISSASDTCKVEPRAADVLALLARQRGAVVSRQRLLDECWGEGSGSDEALTQAIAQIRRSLESLGAARDLLTTYPKRGYRLAAGTATARTAERKTSLRASIVITALVLIVAALIFLLAAKPGWPRHAIRHALGLGPNHAQHHSQ